MRVEPGSSFWTIADCVAANAVASPERVAIEILDPRRPENEPAGSGSEGGTEGRDLPSEVWTYARFWARVEALASVMAATRAGRHGLMVAIMAPNSADHLAAYVACQLVGAAAVPVNNRLAEPEVRFVLDDSDAGLILAAAPFMAVACEAADAAAGTVTVIDMAAVEAPEAEGIDGPPSFRWTGPSGADAAERVAVVAYTSGTTGFPKGSVVTNRGLFTRFAQWSWTFGLSPDQVLSTPGPVFHLSYGGLSLAHLAAGGRNRLMVELDAATALDEYANHATWVFLVPTMTAMIVEQWEARGRPRLDRLQWMLSSGAPGPMALLDRAFDVFPRANITEAYGWTEGGWVTYEVKRRADLVAHSVGRPMLGTQVEVRDEAGRPSGIGQAGEVVARSLTPFDGYLGNTDATAAALTDDGYCRSGDVGIRQADGRLLIVDRVKDMIISGGENIYCAEVERILVDHAGVAEAAVVGLPDDTWGERVTAVVVGRPGSTPEPSEIVAHCRTYLAGYKCPKQVVIVDELPRNPMGKVQKFRLLEQLEVEVGER